MDELYLRPYRDYKALLAEPDDMTEHERERLERIKAIYPEVREIVEDSIRRLQKSVMAAEIEMVRLRESVMADERMADRLIDFLNGEDVEARHEEHG